MSGSETKSERETNGSSPSEADRTSLVDFLATPRRRSSIPAPQPEAPVLEAQAPASAETAAPTAEAEADLPAPKPAVEAEANDDGAALVSTASQDATDATTATADIPARPSEAPTPTAPAASSEPPPATIAEAIRVGAESRASVAPRPETDAAARSLIPVATSTTEDSAPASAPDGELEEDFGVPGAGPPWSSAAVRRATYVALLAAAAAVPAWVVFRARSVDVQARSDTPAPKIAAAAAGPSTLQPPREIEGDDEDIAEPAPPPVAVDPAKANDVRREARRLLEAGIIEQGVAAARSAIALDPAHPESYVLLAAGLQDMGRWAESREVFSRCVNKSKNGINTECVYFATSGTLTNR